MPPDSIRCGQKLFMVDVIRFADDEIERSTGPYTETQAEKVEVKLIADLDHEQFYTAIRRATTTELSIV